MEPGHIDETNIKWNEPLALRMGIITPMYKWEWCFHGDWHAMTVKAYSAPNAFYRLMHRLVLDIHWRKYQA